MYDALFIGGGFYGTVIASYLHKLRGFSRILMVEMGNGLLLRASYNNQARVHNGYHYPRSFTTAFRSRVNLPRFVRDWPQAIDKDFTKLYAIARRSSKVTAKQFVRFCHEIGACIEPAEPNQRALFTPRLIEDVFLVQEYAFDATQLASWAKAELTECKIPVRFQTKATTLNPAPSGIRVTLRGKDGSEEEVCAHYVFNCTYSGLNQYGGAFRQTQTRLKQEITELALVAPPAELKDLGVTVMDGAFFSIMPFPARGLHSLSHVRYTPHLHWADKQGVDPYAKLAHYDKATRVDRMLRDAGRYLPCVLDSKYQDSLFEVKTVLVKNEGDDGRPILYEKHQELPGLFSILGGKIDNVYDVLAKLETETFTL